MVDDLEVSLTQGMHPGFYNLSKDYEVIRKQRAKEFAGQLMKIIGEKLL